MNYYNKTSMGILLLVSQFAVAGGAGSTMGNAPQQLVPSNALEPVVVAPKQISAQEREARQDAARAAWERAAEQEEADRKARHAKVIRPGQNTGRAQPSEADKKRIASIQAGDEPDRESFPVADKPLTVQQIEEQRALHNKKLGESTRLLTRKIDRRALGKKPATRQQEELQQLGWVEDAEHDRQEAAENERLRRLQKNAKRHLQTLSVLGEQPKRAT